MCRSNLLLWCVLLLVVYATENQVIREDEQYNIVQYESHGDSAIIRYHDSNFTRDNGNSVQQQYRRNYAIRLSEYTKNYYEEDNRDTPAELRDNTKTNYGDYFTMSCELRPENNTDKGNSSNMCNSTVCVTICCQLGYRMIKKNCTPGANYSRFPEVTGTNKNVDKIFHLIVSDPCLGFKCHWFDPEVYLVDEHTILTNGSLHQLNSGSILDSMFDILGYDCFTVVKKDTYELSMCPDTKTATTVDKTETYNPYRQNPYRGMPASLVASLPFLLVTFVVYMILPELWNTHGYALRAYVGTLIVAYTCLTITRTVLRKDIPYNTCIVFAFIIYFSFIAGFFWLHVICFHMWWMFRKYRPLQRNVKQRGRKKLILYSIYAWGCSCMLCIFCAILDFVPGVNTLVSNSFIKPGIGEDRCWFNSDEAKLLYFYGPATVIVICNICLFVSTTLKFIRHKANMDHYVSSSESTIHDGKHWFRLFVKLSLMMVFHYTVNWSLAVIIWVYKTAPDYVWYLSDLTIAIHGFNVFIIFVWNDKVKKLLMERFRDHKFACCLFSKSSQNCDCPDIPLHAYHITTEVTPFPVKVSVYKRIYTTFVRQKRPTISYGLGTTEGKGFYRAYSQPGTEN